LSSGQSKQLASVQTAHCEPEIFPPKSLAVQKYPFWISQVLQASTFTPVGLGPTSQNSLPATGAKKFSLLPQVCTRHLLEGTCKMY
jgi:hypothetical protein